MTAGYRLLVKTESGIDVLTHSQDTLLLRKIQNYVIFFGSSI